MIEINERFTLRRDRYNWILTETYWGQDKDGNPKKHTRESYHPWQPEPVWEEVLAGLPE